MLPPPLHGLQGLGVPVEASEGGRLLAWKKQSRESGTPVGREFVRGIGPVSLPAKFGGSDGCGGGSADRSAETQHPNRRVH